jgi:UDP-N-acetyl-D-mannosaminuronic acid dehydrogenase
MKRIMNCKILKLRSTAVELSTLTENSFQDLNRAFANELALICEQFGANLLYVIRFANSHPIVNIHFPGPGVGGPCLTNDTYMLIQGKKIGSSLIRLVRNTIDAMPDYVVITLIDIFKSDSEFNDLKILILGLAYKPGVNDNRRSPTIDIIDKVKEHGVKNIFVHDPYGRIFWSYKDQWEFRCHIKKF